MPYPFAPASHELYSYYLVVGTVLEAARQRANVTQVELARRLAKPQSFVSAFEVEKRRVDVIEFLLITQTLGAEPLHVFCGHPQIAR